MVIIQVKKESLSHTQTIFSRIFTSACLFKDFLATKEIVSALARLGIASTPILPVALYLALKLLNHSLISED